MRRFLQVTLGLLFLATAVGKLLDNRGFAEVLGTYRLLPPATLLVMGLTISLAELAFGLAVFVRPFWAGVGMLAMNAGYTLLAIVTNLRGLKLENCGCFGVFWGRPMTWGTVVEDAVLTAVTAAFVLLSAPGRYYKAAQAHPRSESEYQRASA